MKLHLVRDAIHDKKIVMTHITGTEQIADLFTKALPVKQHEKFTNKLITSISERKYINTVSVLDEEAAQYHLCNANQHC